MKGIKDFIINLKPTQFKLHIFIGDRKKAAVRMTKCFGLDEDYHYENNDTPYCNWIVNKKGVNDGNQFYG